LKYDAAFTCRNSGELLLHPESFHCRGAGEMVGDLSLKKLSRGNGIS